ncbi:large conductance mechanosensitive channel protein MscL [Microbacterium sp. P05]|uniref:large conductance mechanosensitive channel protein MscL n=1 Tax=Microbacterium sp. P05 TaxID=3366948 RepID=UPI0037476C52
MIKGFKEFILRGNVIDLAVAVVIGAAFTAIVNTMVQGFINPLIGFVFQMGDLSDWNWTVRTLSGGEATFAFGTIVVALINFVAVAAIVYFVFVFPMNRFKQRAAARAGVETGADHTPTLPTEQELLMQIRDLLEKQNGSAAKV